jgi:pimeloyl-ACP methyl ester carboxylesterase
MTTIDSTAPPTTAPPRELRVEAAGVQLGLLDYGEPGAAGAASEAESAAADPDAGPLSGDAPRLLLLHGIRDLAWSMDPIAQALRHRYRVLALDLRGHGASEHPGAYTFPHYCADLHRVLDRLGIERATLVGHSLGGQIVCIYAALFPERARAVVTIEGLGPPRPPGPDETEERRVHGRAAVEMLAGLDPQPRRLADLDEAWARVRANHPSLDPERARFLTERGTIALPDGGLRWRWDPRVQGTWSSTTRMANEERWSWVSCPTLVVTGGRAGRFWRDRRGMREADDGGMSPEEKARRVACFRDARHVDIAAAGHMVHFDAPEELNRAIAEFLDSLAD